MTPHTDPDTGDHARAGWGQIKTAQWGQMGLSFSSRRPTTIACPARRASWVGIYASPVAMASPGPVMDIRAALLS